MATKFRNFCNSYARYSANFTDYACFFWTVLFIDVEKVSTNNDRWYLTSGGVVTDDQRHSILLYRPLVLISGDWMIPQNKFNCLANYQVTLCLWRTNLYTGPRIVGLIYVA